MTERHTWIKKQAGRGTWWECSKCGCTKQKFWGLPWHYDTPNDGYPTIKAPECKQYKSNQP